MNLQPSDPKNLSPRNLHPVQQEENENLSFDLLWLLGVLSRHMFAILCVFTLTFVLGLFLFLREPPMYEANARLKIELRRPVFDFENYLTFETISEQFYFTQLGILQSRNIAKQVLGEVGEETFYYALLESGLIPTSLQTAVAEGVASEVLSSSEAVSTLVNTYLKIIQISPDRLSPQIYSLSVKTPMPEFSQRIANLHAAIYIEYSREDNAIFTEEYIEGLERQLVQLELDINKRDENILRFKEENAFFEIQGMASFDPVQDIDDRLSRVREQLGVAMDEVNRTQASYESLFANGQVGQRDSIREEVITSLTLEKLRAKQTELMQAWAEVKDKYLERHPVYISTKSQLDVVVTALEDEVLTQVARARSAYEEALARRAELVVQEKNFIEEKYRRDEQWRHLKNMEQAREQLIEQKTSILKDLQNAKGSLETQKETRNRVFKILDPAEVPSAPVNRDWPRIFLLSFAAAISAALSGALLLEYRDRSIRTPQQIENLTNISVMGSIPHFNEDDVSCVEGRLQEYSVSQAGEAFIALRTRLLFSDLIQQAQSILISSSMEREGKSTVAVNLASSLALIGRRVVLVDCDLRKPSLHRFFGEERSPGLVDVISGVETLDPVVIETDLPGLFMLPAGKKHVHPSEIFTSLAFDEMMTMLKQDYDFVIIDTPPVLVSPDSALLSAKMDILLMVVRHGFIVNEDLVTAVDHVHRSGGEVFSFILNDVPRSEKFVYSRYHYGEAESVM
jgi:polysaccharide biosynthesis transport protein